MFANFDHDDFRKARKALFATSATLIVLSVANINDGEVTIGGFVIELKIDQVLTWLRMFVIYFTFIFVIRLVQDLNAQNIERLKNRTAEAVKLAEYEERIAQRRIENNGSQTEEIFERLSAMERDNSDLALSAFARDRALYIAADVFPAAFISMLAITGLGSWLAQLLMS